LKTKFKEKISKSNQIETTSNEINSIIEIDDPKFEPVKYEHPLESNIIPLSFLIFGLSLITLSL